MKKSIGGAYVYNLIIVFLLIAFGFLMASFSYSKAYRVSKGILKIIENYSGYAGTSSPTATAITNYLNGMGYNKFPITIDYCPQKKNSSGTEISANWAQDGLCIYKVDETPCPAKANNLKSTNTTCYITYGVVSYMSIDLPLIELVRVPIYGETERIYVFNN